MFSAEVNALLFEGANADISAAAAFVLKTDHAIAQRKQSVVASYSDKVAGFESCAALTNQDRSTAYKLTIKPFDTQKLWLTVPAIPGTALSFFVSHDCLALEENGADLHPHHLLPMPSRSPVLLAALLLENKHFLVFALFKNCRFHTR